jgi:hypothetical protein
MLYAGLDLSRHRMDMHLMNRAGQPVLVCAAPPDADGLRGLTRQVAGMGQPVAAAIESMNGARFVHDQLELAGWQVQVADAQKVKAWPHWRARPTGSTRSAGRVRSATCSAQAAERCSTGWACLSRGRAQPPLRWPSSTTWTPRSTPASASCVGWAHAYVPLLMTAPGIAWSWGTRSPPRSATSPDSRARRRSCAATPGCAHGSTSPAIVTTAARRPVTAPPTCAGPD